MDVPRIRDPKRLILGAYRRLNRKSSVGLSWKRQGAFITFDWGGFVLAPSLPALFARHHYEVQAIRRVLAGKHIERSLEFGCGFGRLTPTFASLSRQHIAIDINRQAILAARSTYPTLDFRLYAGGLLPFPTDGFDLVVTWTVLQHIPPAMIDATVSDIVRVLAPRGRLLLCEETRSPGAPSDHAWHREPSFYADRLHPLQMTYSSPIEEIDGIPGLSSPGLIMLFEGTR